MFSLYKNEDYTFIEIIDSIVGNTPNREWSGKGVVKDSDSMVVSAGVESFDTRIRLYIKPNEAFVKEFDTLVGQAIRYNGVDYRIDGQLIGRDLDLGKIKFIKLTLKRENIIWHSQSELN